MIIKKKLFYIKLIKKIELFYKKSRVILLLNVFLMLKKSYFQREK